MPHEYEPFPLKKIGADHKRAYAILKDSHDINWICTAPPEIVNLPHTGTTKVSTIKLNRFFIIINFSQIYFKTF